MADQGSSQRGLGRVRRIRRIASVCAVLLLPLLSRGQEYTYLNTLKIDYGRIWCDPVFDGTNIVISCESNGGILAASFDLQLNQLSPLAVVASSNDTYMNDSIADHKHVFQGDSHYVAFSISGVSSNEGQGGYMYMVKMDRTLARVDMVTVVSNDPPTNDMLLFGDGDFLYVGKFLPGIGHRIYKYSGDLTNVATFDLGGFGPGTDDRHVNGAVGKFFGEECHIISRDFMMPSNNQHVYHIAFDTNGTVTTHKEVIMTDTGHLGMVTGLSLDTNQDVMVVHYTHTATGEGEVFAAIFDTNWNYRAHHRAVTGICARPHSVITDGRLYLGYDRGLETFVSTFAVGDVHPADPLFTYSFETGGVFHQAADSWTNLAVASDLDSWDGTVVDTNGASGRAISDDGWNVLDLSRYYEFSIAVSSGYEMAVIELSFEDMATASGAATWQLRSEHDLYASALGSGVTHSSWTSNTLAVGLLGREATNTFRIYGQGAAVSAGSWCLDNVRIRGDIETAGWADDDGDGMVNSWEFRHMGTKTSLIASADNDADGVTNYAEFVADTIPLHQHDLFRLTYVGSTNGSNAMVKFDSSMARRYTLEAVTNLVDQTNWLVVASNFMGNGGEMFLEDTNTAGSTFYRAEVSVP